MSRRLSHDGIAGSSRIDDREAEKEDQGAKPGAAEEEPVLNREKECQRKEEKGQQRVGEFFYLARGR